jgi:hypothetical protein
VIFLMCCWIQFASIPWEFLHLLSSRKLVYNLLFCCFLICFGIRVIMES